MTVLLTLAEKQGPFTTAHGVSSNDLAFVQMPRTVSNGIFDRLASSGDSDKGE